MNKLRNAGIIGTGSCLPDKIVTNQDMEKIVDTTDEWVRTRTGISVSKIKYFCQSLCTDYKYFVKAPCSYKAVCNGKPV